MAIIPDHFFDAVVAIGTYNSGSNSKEWIGTGFLVGRKEPNDNKYTIYLISNYHLFEGNSRLVVRFNQKETYSITDYEIDLWHGDKPLFSRHPTADISAIQIAPVVLKRDMSVFNFFPLDQNALSINQMCATGVVEGTIAYSLGFPMNLVGSSRKTPICRIGCISRISDLFEDPSLQEYLIDLQAVPGNSGAPVINRPEHVHITGTNHNTTANLIGIIHASLDYSEDNNDYMVNSGIALVHPVDLISEVVELEYNRIKE